jgi:hypothetical protein
MRLDRPRQSFVNNIFKIVTLYSKQQIVTSRSATERSSQEWSLIFEKRFINSRESLVTSAWSKIAEPGRTLPTLIARQESVSFARDPSEWRLKPIVIATVLLATELQCLVVPCRRLGR